MHKRFSWIVNKEHKLFAITYKNNTNATRTDAEKNHFTHINITRYHGCGDGGVGVGAGAVK